MRTTPLSLWAKQAFDSSVRNTVFQCLGFSPNPAVYEQVSVSTTIGGLGIRRVVDHANGAFAASWHESRVITMERGWDRPDVCSDDYDSQNRASVLTDAAIMKKLIESADKREAQRLNRLDSPHANAWLSARPSTVDGKDTILPPKIFRTAVARLLGQPVYSNSAPCPLCEQNMDVFGDHALCCKKSGDRITRHNRL